LTLSSSNIDPSIVDDTASALVGENAVIASRLKFIDQNQKMSKKRRG